MIAKGNQPAVVVPVSTEHGDLACQFGHSKKKQTPQVCVTFEILRGPYAGQRISWFGYFTDKSEKRTLEALRICGFEGDDIDKFSDQRPTNEVQLVIEHETDEEGKTRAKVAWVNDPTFGGGMKMENALTGGELRKFGAKFKAALKAIPAMKTVEAKREAPSGAVDDGVNRDGFNQAPPDDGGGHPAEDPADSIPF